MRVHVVGIKSFTHRGNIRYQYNQVPQTEGRYTMKDLLAADILEFSFSHSITKEQRFNVLKMWAEKYNKSWKEVDYPNCRKFSSRL